MSGSSDKEREAKRGGGSCGGGRMRIGILVQALTRGDEVGVSTAPALTRGTPWGGGGAVTHWGGLRTRTTRRPLEAATWGRRYAKFTCFTSTKVRILTAEELRGRCWGRGRRAASTSMLTYAHVCWRMLAYAQVLGSRVTSRIYESADVC